VCGSVTSSPSASVSVARHAGGEVVIVEHVAVAIEEPDGIAAQGDHLVAVGALPEPPERLGVKAFRHHRQLGGRPLRSENLEDSRCGEDRESVAGVIPKLRVAGQLLEGFQEPGDFIRGILLPERLLQFLRQISEASRILPIVRVMPVGRLKKRETERLRAGERVAEIGREWSHHGRQIGDSANSTA